MIMMKLFSGLQKITICTVLLSAFSLQLSAQWRLKTLSWNIESADSDIESISKYLEDLSGFDVIGLSEVAPANASKLLASTGTREGAKGNAASNFNYVIGETGENSRLMIIWDDNRFELVNGKAYELDNLNSEWLGHRSPLFVQLRNRKNNTQFIYMTNHLARGDEALRQKQAKGLVEWLKTQTIPVIATGDFNFDYDLDDGEGNTAFNLMTELGTWKWLKPERLRKSQSSFSYNSILDFAFVGKMPENWTGYSEILMTQTPFIDDKTHSDHRPLEATFYISPPKSKAETE